MAPSMRLLKNYFFALSIAKKHVVNWLELLLRALFGVDGRFSSRSGGFIRCNARLLLKQLYTLEKLWRNYNETLPNVKFGKDIIILQDYFGRDFAIPLMTPLKTSSILPMSFLLQEYPIDVNGETVLDIGAYLGDTPLLWLYKKARAVIAVEPVPTHFKFLQMNVAGLPVTCLNLAVGIAIPDLPHLEGSASYGVKEVGHQRDFLDIPVTNLVELVKKYKPTVVKIDCEGCEHFIADQLAELPRLGVKKIIVEFHNMKNLEAHVTANLLTEQLKGGKFIKASRSKNVVLWDWS